jgi:DNA-binding NarL/FixJ family response regulator
VSGKPGLRRHQFDPVVLMLTRRQIQAWRELARGKTDKDIAAAMSISLNGAKAHVSALYRQLGISTVAGEHHRVMAAMLAVQFGIVEV